VPVVLGAVAFVTAVLTLVIKWQAVRKNRQEEKALAAEKSRISTGVVFEKIRVDKDNPYWRESTPSDRTTAALRTPVESSSCKQFFHIDKVISGADPSFDVILRNDGTREVSILAIGVLVLRVAHYSYELPVAGLITEARKLTASEAYWVEMPDIFDQTCHFDFDGGDPPAEVNQLIRKDCEPYVLPPEGRFRYTLVLRGYASMPNNAILRLWVETSGGSRESNDVYLRYALGY
jgi:hypothetical protein